MKHGYNLTPLGCLLNSPWEYDLINDSLYNIQILRINIEISSKGYRYTPNQAQLVFQLQRDMSLRYWVKNDYINSPSDTSLDGAIMKHGSPG